VVSGSSICANTKLRIKSYWLQDEKKAICKFKPKEEHSAGLPNVTNGGIVATMIDCHAVCTAVADAYSRRGVIVGSPLIDMSKFPRLQYVTASLHIEYQKPTPQITTSTLEAHVTKVEGRKSWVHVDVIDSSGMISATGDVLAVQLKSNRTNL